MSDFYIIALGSNQRHHLYGAPRQIVRAAMEECAALGTVVARSRIIASAPIGPAQRRFANAVCVIESEYDPPALLAGLKRIEREFGRRAGQRWGDRVIDLDIVLWSGGIWANPSLSIPHREMRERDFVLDPAKSIAGAWRDPVTGRTLNQLAALLRKPRRCKSRHDA